jgi:hypothetical protein
LNRNPSGRPGGARFWVLAVLITLAAVVYQRMIGPTRPVLGTAALASSHLRYRLERTYGGGGDAPIRVGPVGEEVSAVLATRRYKTDDPWDVRPMKRDGRYLSGTLPHQPPAGKVVYRIFLQEGTDPAASEREPYQAADLAGAVPEGSIPIPASGPVVLRFHGRVPVPVIIAHVLLMFTGMLWANRAGIEALRRNGRTRRYAFSTLGLLAAGGLVFGPLVQWYSFGKFWTGFPFGFDLTDNKTLIAVVFWVAAVAAILIVERRPAAIRDGSPATRTPGLRSAQGWVLAAAIVTLVVFSIPHSVIGSELDYSKQTISTVR